MPCFDSAEAAGAYHDSDALNLAKRRLCDAHWFIATLGNDRLRDPAKADEHVLIALGPIWGG
jgi:hypothetical protein